MPLSTTTSDATTPDSPRSLPEIHRTIDVPNEQGSFLQNWRAFAGPALLVSVGYMDPGNWSTDLAAGAQYRYALLWVVALSSAMAIVLQICAARLGIVTGKDLARASHDYIPKWTRWPNWLATEIAIGACDLAEVLGSAVALHLLFPKISIFLGVFITAFDVMLLMGLQGLGFRKIESFIFVLVSTIAGCYFIELFVFGSVIPEAPAIASALFHPRIADKESLFLAIGIIGATVMPHNLYLHSAIVQTRRYQRDESSIRRAIKFNSFDSVIALTLAFLVNAAILILAAMTFFGKHDLKLPDGTPIETDWIQGAFHTLSPLLGATGASILFAIALLASGQSSTVTGTLAGQVVMEGFMSWKVRPWVRRLITRGLAIIPALVVIGLYGDKKVNDLIVISQVILGIQLPFAMIPLMYFTCNSKLMGRHVNPKWLKIAGWTCVTVITALDAYYLLSLPFN